MCQPCSSLDALSRPGTSSQTTASWRRVYTRLSPSLNCTVWRPVLPSNALTLPTYQRPIAGQNTFTCSMQEDVSICMCDGKDRSSLLRNLSETALHQCGEERQPMGLALQMVPLRPPIKQIAMPLWSRSTAGMGMTASITRVVCNLLVNTAMHRTSWWEAVQ